jgi:hypothetical protein
MRTRSKEGQPNKTVLKRAKRAKEEVSQRRKSLKVFDRVYLLLDVATQEAIRITWSKKPKKNRD